ncbi:MAG: DUF5010 C-terminal domain-containing protein [Colwellia sp.]
MNKRKLSKRSITAIALATAMVCGNGLAAQAGFSTQNGGTTGGAGGATVYATTGTQIHAAICNRAADDTPLIIEVEGTIDHSNTFKQSGNCNTADGVIELKEISNISIVGVGNGALFDELGIHIRASSNIILQNLHIRNVKKSGSPTSNGGDAIGLESGVSNVWADHLTLEASGGESDGYDSLFDMKADSTYVTVSYSIFRNSGRGGLVGSSSSDTENGPVTYHHNHYQNMDSRVPLMRGRLGHTYNNHFDGINKSGINVRVGGKMLVENNYFEDAKDPLGTFYTNDVGYWEVSGNIFTDSVVWTADDDKNHPAGPNPVSTASVSVPYSYAIDDADCVVGIVAATAGANKGVNFSDGSCSVVSPDPDPVDPDPVDPVDPPSEGGDEVLNITESGMSSDFFTISGNLSSSKGTVSYNGLTLTQALKIESSTSITFSSVADGELVLVFNDGEDGDIKIDGTSYAVSNGVLSLDISAGSHTISKNNTMNLYYISLGYNGDPIDPDPVDPDPVVPGTVSASASVSDSDVTINWSTENITVTGQEVYRDTDSNLSGRVRIATGLVGNSFTDYNVADGNYYYSVKITGDDGTTYNSSAIAANVLTATSVSEVFEENANGFCLVDGAVESDHSGYTGSGYANTDNEAGKGVDYAISVPSAGSYTLAVRYANGSSDRPAAILVNDVLVGSIAMAGTGAWASYTTDSEVTVSLVSGLNFIRLQATGSSGLGNVDSLTVTGIAPTGGDCNGEIGDGGIVVPPVDPVDPDPVDPVYPNADCADLVNNDSINWRESSLQTDQEIIACLSESLGTPVGYGEAATGGYNANGGSNLVIITDNQPEDQILAAISSADHNWIVFDKDDFANETAIMMYRPYCADSSMQSALGVNEATCRDPQAWCSANGVSSSDCLLTFFNDELNDSSLPVRNYLIDSNTTIDGRGAKATFTFNGFKIGADSSGASTHQSENVIITNNKFVGVGHTEDHNLDPDMIRSTGESHDIWIHQNTFDTTGDSAFDVKVGAYDITVSFNKLVNVKRAALHGSSDSRTINQQITTTLHNNLFVTTDDNFGASSYNTMRRVPLLRRGQTHMFNNVFYGYRKDVMSIRKGGRALLEDNLFMNPVDNSKGDDLADWAEVLFDDAVTEGSLDITGSYVYESGSNCTPSGASASLDVSVGSVPDMFGDYNSASKNTINANQFSVGHDLRDYVMATAGKGAETSYVSSYTVGESVVISAAPSSCQ